MPKSFLIRRKRELGEDGLLGADSEITETNNSLLFPDIPLKKEKDPAFQEHETPVPELSTDLNNNATKNCSKLNSEMTNCVDKACTLENRCNCKICDEKQQKCFIKVEESSRRGQKSPHLNGERSKVHELCVNGDSHCDCRGTQQIMECTKNSMPCVAFQRNMHPTYSHCRCFACVSSHQNGRRRTEEVYQSQQCKLKFRTSCNCCDLPRDSAYNRGQVWTTDFSQMVDNCKDCFERAYRSIAYRGRDIYNITPSCCPVKYHEVDSKRGNVGCEVTTVDEKDAVLFPKGDIKTERKAEYIHYTSRASPEPLDTQTIQTSAMEMCETKNFKFNHQQKHSEEITYQEESTYPEDMDSSLSPEQNSHISENSTELCNINEEEMYVPETENYSLNCSDHNKNRQQALRSSMGRGKRQRCGKRGGRIKNNRLLANEHERRRVAELNSGFQELRKVLPGYSDDTKLTKIKILRYAILYIAHLAKVLDEGYLGPLVLS